MKYAQIAGNYSLGLIKNPGVTVMISVSKYFWRTLLL